MDSNIYKYTNKSSILKILLSAGADYSKPDTSVHSIVTLMIHEARADMVEFMLSVDKDYVCNKDYVVLSSLMSAATCNQTEIAKMIIDADRSMLNQVCKYGMTALTYATRYGNIDMVKLLLKEGASVSIAEEKYYSLIHIAASSRNVDLVKLFVDMGHDPAKEDSMNLTPLMTAVKFGNIETIKFLLSISIPNDSSMRIGAALQIAQRSLQNMRKKDDKVRYKTIIELLEAADT